VRRQGLEPRTRGLREDRCDTRSALPAQMSRVDALKAQIARGDDRYSSHESFHGHQSQGCLIVTERSREALAYYALSRNHDRSVEINALCLPTQAPP
jgi:hypothetical protein